MLESAIAPKNLALAILQCCGRLVIGRDQRGGDCPHPEPPPSVTLVHVERAGPDFLLIEQDIADQFARQRFRPLGVARIKDTIPGILAGVRLFGSRLG